MRKIAANYIMPVTSPPLNNGIIVLEKDGTILDLIDTGGYLRESSKLEFYNGIIIPGFVLPWYRVENIRYHAGTLSETEFSELDSSLQSRGIKGIGIVEQQAGHFAAKQESATSYHTIHEICPAEGQDEFEVFQESIEIISAAWNEYNQPCSISCCSSSLMETDIMEYLLAYAAAHQLVIPLENKPQWPLSVQLSRLIQKLYNNSEEPSAGIRSNAYLLMVHDLADRVSARENVLEDRLTVFHSLRPRKDLNILKALLALQEAAPGRFLTDILPAYTLESAKAIFLDDLLGSIETGKKPGLNLLSGTEPDRFRLTKKTTLRVLA